MFHRILMLCCLLATCSCMPSLPFVGGDLDATLTAADKSWSLRLAPGWSVSGKDAKGADAGPGFSRVLVHTDSAQSPQGYPTLVVREVRQPTPLGLFEFLSKDKGLEFSELWSVGKDKYTLKSAQVDPKGRVLTYWLSPLDGQGVEYYGAMYLTAWGRLECIGLTRAGMSQKYAKDMTDMFASVRIDDKAAPGGTKPGDLARYLARTYVQAMERERQALSRLAGEIASYGGSGLDAQQKGMLQTTFARSAAACQEASAALESQLSHLAGTGKTPEQSSAWQTQMERLDAQATAIETVAMNLRDTTAVGLAEKAEVRAKRLVTLAREARKLPL